MSVLMILKLRCVVLLIYRHHHCAVLIRASLTSGSKRQSNKHFSMSFRAQLADFRAAAGFDDPKRQANKENVLGDNETPAKTKKRRTKMGVRKRMLSRIGPAVAQAGPPLCVCSSLCRPPTRPSTPCRLAKPKAAALARRCNDSRAIATRALYRWMNMRSPRTPMWRGSARPSSGSKWRQD